MKAHKNIDELPIIQGLWIGDTLSVMEQLSIFSFLKNGHPFHLYVYDEIKNVPVGCVVKDANEIIDQSRIFKYKDSNSYAGFSNIFRYKLLYEKGNYWVDMDVVCLRPFTSESDFVFSSEVPRIPLFFTGINCGVMKAIVGSDIMKYCYDECNRRNPQELKCGETGPRLISSAVKRFSLQKYVATPKTYCPVNFWKVKKLISKSYGLGYFNGNNLSETIAIHFWNEMWRRNNIDKNGIFPAESIYEQLKQRYL